MSCRPPAGAQRHLEPTCRRYWCCGQSMWVAYHTTRTITRLDGLHDLILHVRRCRNPACVLYRRPYRPEEEGLWALPHGEFGLDVIALVGSLRYISHRSIPEIHQTLCDRGISIAQRTVTHLLQRYEELVSLRLADQQRLHERFKKQGQIILAIDGLQPDVGHEVLWVLRDCLFGEVLLARSLLSACEADLARYNRLLMFPSVGSSLTDSTPFVRRFKRYCRMFHISCATSITYVKQPNRCTKPTNMPKRS